MCGRFSFVVEKKKVQQALPNIKIDGTLATLYNIAPTQLAYVVTNQEPFQLQTMKWGLIPHWAMNAKKAGTLINARMETIGEKLSFSTPFRTRRCVVLADSFYEWKTEGGKKIPYRILLKNKGLMLFAGIWDEWQGIKTFSIITTQPNKEMSVLHDRMPVVLRGVKNMETWLSPTDLDTLSALCGQPKDDLLITYRVSEKINSVYNDSPDMHTEIHTEQPPDLTLF